MAAQVTRYRTADQTVTAITGEAGHKFTPMVWIDSPIRLHKVPNETAAKYGEAYDRPTVKSAARTMLRAGKRLGITKAAKQFLREVTRS